MEFIGKLQYMKVDGGHIDQMDRPVSHANYQTSQAASCIAETSFHSG